MSSVFQTGVCTTGETCRTTARSVQRPAGARHERTLAAVRSRSLVGSSAMDDGCIAVSTVSGFQCRQPLAKRTLFLPPTGLIPNEPRTYIKPFWRNSQMEMVMRALEAFSGEKLVWR